MSLHPAVIPSCDVTRIVSLVVNSVGSAHSRRAYAAAILDFVAWARAKQWSVLNKALVQEYRTELEESGRAPASINVRLSAIRKFAAEAADNGLLDPEIAAGIGRVKGVRRAGVRTGNWLSQEQAQNLLSAPDDRTRRGKRDRVALALLIGCGLRRDELAHLSFERLQQRDGRWVIADLIGKGERVRTVAVPAWAKVLMDDWSAVVGEAAGPVLRRIDRHDKVSSRPISAQAVFKIVKNYGLRVGLRFAPHDLRRTYAKLAHRGGAGLDQIQISLGHSSLLTTEKYLGIRQNLTEAPCDRLGLHLPDTFAECLSSAEIASRSCLRT
jgi:integrase